jgi:type II secretory pathway component GspD/PulD (secretin)
MSLVVNQTADVQEQVADVLSSLRRQQDLEVAVEVRILTVSDAVFEKIAPDCTNKGKGDEGTPSRLKMLRDGDVSSLLEAVQGDRRTNVMQAPKITLFNGQQSTLRAVDQQTFVTGVQTTVSERDQAVFIPKTETIPLGFQMALRPAVSADRRYVQLDLKAELSALESDEVPLFPVMTQVRPVGENQAEPVTFTQMIQRPKLTTVALSTTLELPDGGTALLCAGRREREVRDEVPPPVLSDIPALNRLFTKVVRSRQGENVLLLVTPRVLVSEEEEACQKVKAPAAATKSDQLARLLGKYRKACAEGRRAEARKLAERCLNLDPTCFK